MCKKHLSVIFTLIMLTGILFGIASGEENDPEIVDEGGTTDTDDPSKQFQNIDKVWFHDEENDTFQITMKLAGAPHDLRTLYESGQIRNWTNYDYEIYFTVGKTTYAASVRIRYAVYLGAGTPIGGIISPDINWDWEVRNVSYASPYSDDISSESVSTDLGDGEHDYTQSSEETLLTWVINKEWVGVPDDVEGRGYVLNDPWAAVWNADDNPEGQKRKFNSAWDTANSHTNPGRDYQIKGGAVAYLIWLSTSNSEKSTYAGEPAEFFIDARNNGSNDFTVDFTYLYSGGNGWTVQLDPANLTIAKDTTRTFRVLVTPPEDVVNGTTVVVTIGGNIHKVNGGTNETVPIHNQGKVDLRVTALEKEPEEEESSILGAFLEALMNNISIVAGLIAAVVLIIIIIAILKRR